MADNQNKGDAIDIIDQALMEAENSLDDTIKNLTQFQKLLDQPYLKKWRDRIQEITNIKSNLGNLRQELKNQRDKNDQNAIKKHLQAERQLRDKAKKLR
ncbi:hypothetical protein [Nostoc sp. CHAB 5715]|uniref:hypothetical protein n=1 Tax=Nostoc sp. CHAB 5715 TaxID=2780400 RepID=UPI001E4C4C30|nr:hypothetical protein [Nostoc sp. CHAB 5715]MCC5623055.1 hypothetical protein [Nostoc sp. CHAB 5715]